MNNESDQPEPVRSVAEVRRAFAERGLSIAAWAREYGYSAQLVYQILGGRKGCLRGQSHRIAVHLGLKRGAIGTVRDVGLKKYAMSNQRASSKALEEGDPMS